MGGLNWGLITRRYGTSSLPPSEMMNNTFMATIAYYMKHRMKIIPKFLLSLG